MKYTKEPPTKAGWYWIKSTLLGELPIHVDKYRCNDYYYVQDPSDCNHTKRNFLPVVKLGALWSSEPITKPID